MNEWILSFFAQYIYVLSKHLGAYEKKSSDLAQDNNSPTLSLHLRGKYIIIIIVFLK